MPEEKILLDLCTSAQISRRFCVRTKADVALRLHEMACAALRADVT